MQGLQARPSYYTHKQPAARAFVRVLVQRWRALDRTGEVGRAHALQMLEERFANYDLSAMTPQW